MRTRAILLTTAAALLATASAAPAAVPQPPGCSLLDRPDDKAYTIPGTQVSAVDPFGGTYSRSQNFVFRTRGEPAALARLARVEWTVDGVVRHVDDRGPAFQWQGYAQDLAPGDHVIKVTAVPASGAAASVEFALAVTDCPYATFDAFPAPAAGRQATELYWDSARESDAGVAVESVTARAVQNMVAELPRRARGRKAGTLTLKRPGASDVVKTLRVPRRGSVLLRSGRLTVTFAPGAKRFLTITGLPSGTQRVEVVLRGAGTRLVHAKDGCRMALVDGRMTAGGVTAGDISGGQDACAPPA